MEVRIDHIEGSKFQAVARGHRVISDQPPALGGSDQGMTPPELLLASLGTCAGYYAAQYLQTRALPTKGLKVLVSAEKGSAPARLASFRVEVEAPNVIDERHRDGLLRAVQKCLIHNTLRQASDINVLVQIGGSSIAEGDAA